MEDLSSKCENIWTLPNRPLFFVTFFFNCAKDFVRYPPAYNGIV